MHRSRLAGFIIDCERGDLDASVAFWSAALGMPSGGRGGETFERLEASRRDLAIEVQSVEHASRVHLDIETDDVEREVCRLEALGAKRVLQKKSWWVLEAPTGHRFCVIPAADLSHDRGVTTWESPA